MVRALETLATMSYGNRPATLTFLFTDIEGSSRLWEEDTERMKSALARHDALSDELVQRARGTVVKKTGDGILAVFEDPLSAVETAIELQLALGKPRSSDDLALSIRCGLHAGVAESRDNDIFGIPVNRAARIMSAAHGGQTLLSQAVTELVRDRLPASVSLIDLGRHRLRDLARPEHLYQLADPRWRQDFPALRTIDAMPNNLPAQATSFIGRESDQAGIPPLLSRHRLVTLTGPGGIGKTRLALQVGAELLTRYPDGVWFVDLASLTEPALVAEAAAAVFGLNASSTETAAALATYLKDKNALIILDNCEHLVGACAELAHTLLRTCPSISLLASSREGLAVPGEHLFRIASLSTPESAQSVTASEALEYAALRLFVDRADAAVGGFKLTDDNARTVAEICRRLDGIPLAIELAAPRLRILQPQQLLQRLNDRFSVLTGGARTALPRHQTLLATLDWSFDLLSDDEKVLLRRLSVFSGSWTLHAATEVAHDARVPKSEIFGLVSSLVDKSLVTVDLAREAARYKLLESTREYAAGKLSAAGESGWRRRHAQAMLELFGRAEQEWPTAATEAWLQAYGPETENLRAALDWSFGPDGDRILGATLFAHTGSFWIEVSLQREFRRWLELAISEVLEALPPGVAGRVRLAHSQVGSQGDPTYIESATRAVDLARRAGDQTLLGRALSHAGYLVASRDAEKAGSYLMEAEQVLRPLGRTKWLANLLNVMGVVYSIQRREFESRASYAESIAISQEVGDSLGYVAPALNLVDDDFNAGRIESAIVRAETLVEECRQRQRLGLLGLALIYFGDYLLAADRHSDARRIGIEGIRMNRSLGRTAPVNACIETVALATALQNGFERAARLAGYVGAFYDKVQFVRGPTQQRTWDRLIGVLSANLAPEVLERHRAEGSRLSEDTAVSEALAGS